MTARERLLKRRSHEVVAFEHGGIRYIAGLDRFNDGNLAEIFLNAASSTAADVNVRDAAVAVALLPQHGCSVEIRCRALTRHRRLGLSPARAGPRYHREGGVEGALSELRPVPRAVSQDEGHND